jgi:prepilin-type N-terminal cleavage/methylation domain-containing protein
MKNKKGFTLIEMLIAVAIAALFFLSLTVIFTSAHKGMLNAYKNNVLKNKVTYAMTHIQDNLNVASRIDLDEGDFNTVPCDIGSAASDTVFTVDYIAGAYNIDKDEGCYPMDINYSARIFFYCFADTDTDGSRELYYYERTIAGNPNTYCPIVDPVNGFNYTVYPQNSQCGNPQGGITPVMLLEDITNSSVTISRCQYDRIKVMLQVSAPGTEKSKPIEYRTETDFKVGMSAQNF